MEQLLQNPAVQAGVLPFLVALALAAPLGRTRLLGLTQVAGLLVLVALAIGLSFESLTATKKLALVGVGSVAAMLALEFAPLSPGAVRSAVLALLGAGCVWMLWRLLAQREAGPALLAAVLSVAYLVALVESTLRVSADPVRGAAAGLMIGLGTGALAVMGASAVLGLIGISVGAAAGAALLVQMLRGRPAPTGATVALPAVTVAGLVGVLVTQAGSLPWFCLLPVLAAPWAVRLLPDRPQPVWLKAVLSSLLALVPMLAAIALAWFGAAGSS